MKKEEKILLFKEKNVAIYYDKLQNTLIRDEKQDDETIIRSSYKGDEDKYHYVYPFSELLFSKKIAEYVILIFVLNRDGYYETFIIHTETLRMIKGVKFTVNDDRTIGFFFFFSSKYKNRMLEGRFQGCKVSAEKKGFIRIF